MSAPSPPPYYCVDFHAIPAEPCPCGQTRRALIDVPSVPVSLHQVEISAEAQRHYHRTLTETYYILEADAGAWIELDNDRVAARPGICVVIPPGVRHRAVGRIKLLNFVWPKFDPADEWFD